MIGLCALEGLLGREVAMNTPLISVIIVIALIVGSTLSVMNKACKSGHHAWCAPMSTVRHHIKTAAGLIAIADQSHGPPCWPRYAVLHRAYGRNVRFSPKSGHWNSV